MPNAATDKLRGIACIGASAGGLEALTELLEHLPADTGISFVLIQHLDPHRESALVQILGRATSMAVGEVTNNLPVAPNAIHVIPPKCSMTIAGGVLKLHPRRAGAGPQRSIDVFLQSLALDQKERAIGVILSGTASDGTFGLEAIKAEGGITFAQDESARYDSMPRSAVASGCVDFVLAPKAIALELARIAKHPTLASHTAVPKTAGAAGIESRRSTRRGSAKAGRAERLTLSAVVDDVDETASDNGYRKVVSLLRNLSGVDFSLYKPATIRRRINRRLVVNGKRTLEEYARFLRGHPGELEALYSDCLIGVTGFFRDREAFTVLEKKVFPRLLSQQPNGDPLRAWVVGCSTGQEAYSIAMLFEEVAARASRKRKFQVFATDLNDALLDKARHGLYAKTLVRDISPARLRNFFVEESGGYRVKKALREMVVFAHHNLLGDPPFSRLDLISCRNLLIYVEPSLQQRALPTFHYALRSGGVLFLGASESIGSFTDLFDPVDKRHKIYVRKSGPTQGFHLPVKASRKTAPVEQDAGVRYPPLGGNAGTLERAPEQFGVEVNAQREADRLSLNQFSPPGVLINDHFEIVQFRGPTGPYLEPPKGRASFDLLKMAREGLMLPLRTAIGRARKENKTVYRESVRVRENGRTRTIGLQVIPLRNLRERYFLILFHQVRTGAIAAVAEQPKPVPAASKRTKKRDPAVDELARELSDMRDYVQALHEQHEAHNEELQASNEEVQSANEELQSVNEELETSKEELESTNEELATLNEEITHRNAELHRLSGDLINLQSATKLPIVLVAHDMTIRRFNAFAEKHFNLLATDVGRSVGNLKHNLDLPDLEALLHETIETLKAQERETYDKDGRCWLLRIHPYIIDNKIDGAVMLLVDIDKLKRAEHVIVAARDTAQNILETVREPLLVLDEGLRVESANRAFYRTFNATPAQTVGRLIYELGDRDWDVAELRRLLEVILPEHTTLEDFEVVHEFTGLGHRNMLLNARRIEDPTRSAGRILLAIEDITARKRLAEETATRAEEALHEAQSEVAHVTRRIALGELATSIVHEVNQPLAAVVANAEASLLALDRGATVNETREVLQEVVRDAVRASEVIRRVRDLTKTAALSKGLLDLNTAIKEVIPLIRREVANRRITVRLELKPGLPMVLGDRIQLQQVILNLIVNGIEAMSGVAEDKRALVIRTSTNAECQVLVDVQDTGTGIASENIGRVFNAFFTTKPHGLGMGLSVVRSIIQAHAGRVWVSPNANQGTIFQFLLPQAERGGRAPAARHSASATIDQ